MNKFDWLCGVLALSLVAACGDDDDGANDNPGAIDASIVLPVDGAPAIDAFQLPDAAPTFDARPPDLSCADQPDPSGEVPATVTFHGVVQAIGFNGTAPTFDPAADVTVEARGRVGDEALTSSTSDSLGEYGVTLESGGNPVDAYLSLKKASYIDTYLFAPDPLRADGNVPDTILLPTALLAFLPQLGIDLQDGDGVAAVSVVDCEGVGIPGVAPTIEGGDKDTQVIDGSAFLPGTFLVINIPVTQGKGGPLPTPVTLHAEYNGEALQDNEIKVFADAISFTQVHP